MDSDLLDNIHDMAYFLKEKLKDFEFRDYYSDVPNKFNKNLSIIIDEIINYVNNSKLDDISLKRTGSFLSLDNFLCNK